MKFLNKSKANEIINLIGNNKLDKALTSFATYAHESGEKDISNMCTLLQGRLSSIKRSENLGLMSFQDVNREKTILNNSLLNLVDENTFYGNEKIVVEMNTNINVFNFVLNGVNFKDITQLEAWLQKECLNIDAHYTESISLSKTIYSYLKFKWDSEKTTERYGNELKWAIKDLETVKNLKNMYSVKTAIKKLLDTIKEFFYDEMEKDILGVMYDKVLETSSLSDFLFYYEIYYKKFLELNETKDDAEPLLNSWYSAKNDLISQTTGKSLPFVDGKLENFKSKWKMKH